MNRLVYVFDEQICGVKSVQTDDNNKTITFVYEENNDSNTFTENSFYEIIKSYPNYKLYALEVDGNYFTDRIKIKDIEDCFFNDDRMLDRIDLNIWGKLW